jgi:hypothetical protein
MGLPHRDRQPGFEGAIEFAKPGIAVTAWVLGDIFVPASGSNSSSCLQEAVQSADQRYSKSSGRSCVAPISFFLISAPPGIIGSMLK